MSEARGLRLFAVPAGARPDFATVFARGLLRRLAPLPLAAQLDARVLTNAPRSRAAIEAALVAARSGGGPIPRVDVIAELGADPLICPDLPPAVDPLRRLLALTRLADGYLAAAAPARGPRAGAPALADALARLMDELAEEGVPADRLAAAVPGDLAQHWQETLAVTRLAAETWPAMLAESGDRQMDRALRQRRVAEALAADWARQAPPGPIVAAASTGAAAPTAILLAAIARMPDGAVVLPGFDAETPPDVWEAMGPEHPMAPFRRLFESLGATPADVQPWEPEAAAPGPRRRLIAAALRPAPVTDAWVRDAPALARDLGPATEAMTLIEADTPRHEAAAIAVAIREAVETPGARVVLVTPDGALARRVTAALTAFGIEPDDSLGTPLATRPAGVFFRLCLAVAEGAGRAAAAGLLSHPLAAAGLTRAAHRALARRYERRVLRAGPAPAPGLPPLRPWPGDPPDGGADWLARIDAALAPLADALAADAPAGRLLALHRAAAEALSQGAGDAAPAIWEGEDGQALERLLDRLAAAAEGDEAGKLPARSYGALVAAALADQTIRPAPGRPHPRVAIRGPREVRVEGAELMILGGLTEGGWPRLPGADPWLSRPMRRMLGLPSPEAAIGLAAHDFWGAALAPRVVLTRALKSEGTPQIASRWLIRIENLLGGIEGGEAALAAMRERGRTLARIAADLARPAAGLPRAPRPAPAPPVAARPRSLSITEVETLIRDPYSIYAKRVLRLKPWDQLGRPPDARERGQALHEIMAAFVTRLPEYWPGEEEAEALLLAIADDVLARVESWPERRRLIRGRLVRAAPALVLAERDRRAAGDRPIACEAPGKIALPAPAGAVLLRGKIDRVDRAPDGRLRIYDWKSGGLPSSNQIDAGFAQQLHLGAAIVSRGGAEGVAPGEIASGAYLALNAEAKVAEVADLGEALPGHLTALESMLATFDDPATGYFARARAERDAERGDYDHLSRRAEWEDAGE